MTRISDDVVADHLLKRMLDDPDIEPGNVPTTEELVNRLRSLRVVREMRGLVSDSESAELDEHWPMWKLLLLPGGVRSRTEILDKMPDEQIEELRLRLARRSLANTSRGRPRSVPTR